MATSTIKATIPSGAIERYAIYCDWSANSHGIVDSGISAEEYLLLGAYTLGSSNNIIQVSNIDHGNYRFQCLNAVTHQQETTGNVYVFAFVIPNSYIKNI